jgi:hypothetical protein
MKTILFIVLMTASCKTFAQNAEAFRKFPVFNFEKVTEKIFDAMMAKKGVFAWKPTYADLLDFAQNVSPDGYCYTKVDTAFEFNAGGAMHIVIAYATSKSSGEDCHICMPVISVVEFRKEADRSFTLENFRKGFTSFGAFGKSGKYFLLKIGGDKFALVLTSNFESGGETTETKDFYLLDATGFLTKIFTFTSLSSDTNSGEQQNFTLSTLPVQNKAYDDFILTEKKNGILQPNKIQYTFFDQAGVYVVAK